MENLDRPTHGEGENIHARPEWLPPVLGGERQLFGPASKNGKPPEVLQPGEALDPDTMDDMLRRDQKEYERRHDRQIPNK